MYKDTGAEIVKVSPTWKPQSLNAMRRLERLLRRSIYLQGKWRKESGYIYRVGEARIFFLSGEQADQHRRRHRQHAAGVRRSPGREHRQVGSRDQPHGCQPQHHAHLLGHHLDAPHPALPREGRRPPGGACRRRAPPVHHQRRRGQPRSARLRALRRPPRSPSWGASTRTCARSTSPKSWMPPAACSPKRAAC